MAEAEALEIEKARALPLEERIAHNKWRVRNEAWIQAAEEVSSSSGEGAKWCADLSHLFVKGVKDTNVNVQATVLDSLVKVLEVAGVDSPVVNQYGSGICEGIASACLGARPNTVKRSSVAMLSFVELGRGDCVIDALAALAFKHKLSKVTLNAVEIVTEAIKTYGTGGIDPKPAIKVMPDLFESKDAKVRTAVKQLTAELCRWLGEVTISELLLKEVRDSTRKDVEALVSKNSAERAVPLKRMRNQREQGPEGPSETSGEGGEAAQEAPAERAVDVYDLSEPVDVLKGLTDEFWSAIVASKWSLRRDALLSLKKAASAPKIVKGDFAPVVKELRKIITMDSNVACVNAAIDCIEGLSKGLRKNFAPYARQLCPCMLDKFKEKTTSVTRSIHSAIAACTTHCISLADIQDELVQCIKHKNPKIKLETIKLCESVLQATEHAQKFESLYGSVLASAASSTNDPSPLVRESACMLVARFAKAAGSLDALGKYVEPIDAAKKKKIQGILSGGDAAQSKGKAGAHAAAGSAKESATKASKTEGASSKSKTTKDGKASRRRSSLGGASPQQHVSLDNMSDLFEELIGNECYAKLQNSVWKVRLEGVQDIKGRAFDLVGQSDRSFDVLVAGLCSVPGWNDSNFQVLMNVYEVFIQILPRNANAKREVVHMIVDGCVEKIADVKLNSTISTLLELCAGFLGKWKTAQRMHAKACQHKNPKVLVGCIDWISSAFGKSAYVDAGARELIELVRDNLSNSNASIRASTTALIAATIAHKGDEFKDLIKDVKPTLVANINAGVSKLRGQGIEPHATAKDRSPPKAKESATMRRKTPSKASAATPSKQTQAAPKLSDALITKMGSTNWKERLSALEELQRVMDENRDSIKGNLGGLLPALRQRLSDSNKNLVSMCLQILSEILDCCGGGKERLFKQLIMEVLKTTCDNKRSVRESAILTLHAWSNEISLKSMQPYFTIFVTDAKTNMDGKVSLMTFMLQTCKESLPKLEDCMMEVLTIVAECLLDKTIEVREAATKMLKALQAGFDAARVMEAAKEVGEDHAQAITTCMSKFNHATQTTPARPSTAGPARSRLGLTARPGTAGSKRHTPGKSAPMSVTVVEEDLLTFSATKHERARKAPRRSAKRFEDQIRPEDLENLQSSMALCASKELVSCMFSRDFKQQCMAVDMLSSYVAQKSPTHSDNLMSCLDMVLQWISHRICEGNMQLLIKVLDFVGELIAFVSGRGDHLSEYEIHTIYPCLVEKSGHNQDRVRQLFRKHLVGMCQVMHVRQAIPTLLQGYASKNHRTKVVCLEVVEALLDQQSYAVCTPRVLKETALLTAERDANVRSKALNIMVGAYKRMGRDVWKGLNSLSDRIKSTLEQKFKPFEASIEGKASDGSDEHEAVSHPIAHVAAGEHAGDAGRSASPKPLSDQEKAARAWEQAFRRATLEDLSESVEGMKELCHHLLDFGRGQSSLDVAALVGTADVLVKSIGTKVKLIFDKAIEDLFASTNRMPEAGSSRGCKYVLNTLMHSFQHPAIAMAVSEPALRKLMKNLLLLLLNDAVPSLEEGNQLLRALNVLMLKMLENGNRTSSFLSLLWLLGEGGVSVPADLRGRFSDLVIKCLIKQTKHLGTSIESMNLEGVLGAVHAFLSFLGTGVRVNEDDKPLRMVKTILHELCKLKGRGIYASMQNIPRDAQAEQPLIYTYLDLYVQTTRPRETKAKDENGNVAGVVPAIQRSPSAQEVTDIKSELAGIFRTIGDKGTSKQGLEELHAFTLKYPSVDLGMHLNKTSEAFQQYIHDGLKRCATRGTERSPMRALQQ